MKGSPVQVRASALGAVRRPARLLLFFLPSFQDFAEGFLDFGGEGEAEGGVEGVEGERAEAADRGDDLLPALLRAALFVEGLPDVFDEEVDEGAGGGLGVAAEFLDRGEGGGELNAHRHHFLGGADQGGAGSFEALFPDLDEEAELLRFLDQAVVVGAELLDQFLAAVDLGSLGGEGGGDGLAEADEAVGIGPVLTDQAGDRAQLEALRLHLLDQPQASDVLGAVVTNPGPYLRRWQ